MCAIGDVHGCTRLLRGLVGFLRSHVLEASRRNTVVTIGDYVDRGPSSLAALDDVRALAIPGVEIVRLLGNHDFFLALIAGHEDVDAAFVEAWLDVGGETTFREMGLDREDVHRSGVSALRQRIRSILPEGMPAFLSSLAPHHRVGDYLFVHAGLDPAAPLAQHDVSDLVMMREPFLSGTGWAHDFTVVHGHTIRGHEALPHRIAIDTGAFRTGVLSAVHLEGDRMRWLAVTAADSLDALAPLRTTAEIPLPYEGAVILGEDQEGAR
ncbi:Bis(5'-nucleosyl)-tetraphosphatase, symmetrical [Methylobacterium crusticola]|uniref:Bis(5'-nucleosyl)-tetraphosphatase, symmetrical n=1 Tax=Methylobacterium crusticola TaxID=1697972 RepID=A0ABQ4R6W8_9HYPH|nr:metallophosphoesterase [Methylobacterium crusticola]GJD52899.1 Bis(5'-nucleosyl)-tetraphosphatase, symmetrical [Methylobacterium crusticola]